MPTEQNKALLANQICNQIFRNSEWYCNRLRALGKVDLSNYEAIKNAYYDTVSVSYMEQPTRVLKLIIPRYTMGFKKV